MGTRGLYGFHKNGTDKLTYNHWDSYPDSLGKKMAEFLCNSTPLMLKRVWDCIELVDPDSAPTLEQKQKCIAAGWFDKTVGSRSEDDWYCLLRNLQGNLEPYKTAAALGEKMYMIDDSDNFIKDSLFCEYAYIFNCDTQNLEFWIGFQRGPQPGNRYGEEPNKDGYFPCHLAAEFPFNGTLTPDEIVAKMNACEETDDEDAEDVPF